MHKLHLVRLWALTVLVVASFFSAAFLPTTTFAVDNKKPVADNAKALAYFYTMRRCMVETFQIPGVNSITPDQVNNFSWLSG